MAGGFDGTNLVHMRDAANIAAIQNIRQGAPDNIPDFTEALEKVATLTAGSDVISVSDVTGLVAGMRVFGGNLKRQFAYTIKTVGALNTVTLNKIVTVGALDVTLTFAGVKKLYKMNEVSPVGHNYALHYTQDFLADAFNTPDTLENANKTKAAIISNIGPLRYRMTKNSGLFDLNVTLANGTSRRAAGADYPPSLTSHNDQSLIWMTNTPEGAIKGWGGGIADILLNQIAGAINKPLATVSASGNEAFVSGDTARAFFISATGLVRRVPGYTKFSLYDGNDAVDASLGEIIREASQLTPAGETNDFIKSSAPATKLANDYQKVLLNIQEITDPVFSGGASLATGSTDPSDPMPLCANLKQIARMILANNPNRGGTATRAGNTVTVVTELSNGVATRVEGEAFVTVVSANHGLFTSTLNGVNFTDSILLYEDIGVASAVDGFKIVLDPYDPDNKFTIKTTGQTGAIAGLPVTFRLKHNLTTDSKVFFTNPAVDSSLAVDGYQVTEIVNPFTFKVTTTASGAYGGATINTKFKLINVAGQVLYTNTPNMSWDTHGSANHNQLFALNHAIKYFNSLIERIVDADVVTISLSEFGRTTGTNTQGTDHGWGNYAYVFGKSVKGNKVYGTPIDYSPSGPHNIGMLMPTTSVYAYGGCLAKWLGATDAQVLALFPDLANWPENERILGFLDPL